MANFWTDSTHEFEQLTSFPEREKQLLKTPAMNLYLANPRTITEDVVDSYLDLLKGKKLYVDKIMTKKARTQLAYKNASVNVDEDLNDNEVLVDLKKQIDHEAQLKALKMYYDMYMSESYSDIKWRLGSIVGTVEDVGIDDEKFGTLLRGQNYTRSNMSIMYEKLYTRFGKVYKALNTYASLGFPPYKIGAQNELGDETNIMTQVLSENPDATFDQDKFTINREGFTFRDIGMKALSDYINYLQWVIDGACGIVSTYLTEWDLSVYMQEGLMMPQVNGKPMRLYLNYRIYDDNPLANTETDQYLNDRALAFNVCGSAVSKLEADNEKYWRPSDFPQSVWWTPYIKDKDWRMQKFKIDMSASEEEDMIIPYMSIYDEASSTFDYVGSTSVKDIIRNQDYIGLAMSTKNTERLHYYDAFYTSPDDGLTDFDIKLNNMMKKVAGADAGWSTRKGMDIDYGLVAAKQEMLMNGGYYGGPQQVGNSGGYMNRAFIQNAMEGSGDSSKMTMSKMMSKARQSGNQNDSSSELSQTDNIARESLDSLFDNSKNTAVMAKMVGINRLSATLYGGPHGSSYSLYNLRSFYEDSQINRNIPRFELESFKNNFNNEAKGFINSEFYYKRDSEDLKNEKRFYEKETFVEESNVRYGNSPSSNVANLKNGSFCNFRYETVDCEYEVEELVTGNVVYNNITKQYEASLPEKDSLGNTIIYTGEIQWKTETIPAPKGNIFFNIISWFSALFNIVSGESYTVEVPMRMGKFKKVGSKVIKIYNVMSMPNTNWKIVQHGFESFMPNQEDATKLWNMVSANKYKFTFYTDCQEFINEKNPCFMLKFDNKEDENTFIQKMIQYGRGENGASLPSTVWFFQGNRDFNDSEIPECSFRAPCYVKYYKNVCEKWKRGLFGKEHLEGYSYTYIPFIFVDLINADKCIDNLQLKPMSNASISGEAQPVHISSVYSSPIGFNASNPLEKFKSEYSDTIISYKRKHVSDAGMKSFWSAIVMIAAIVLLPAMPLLGTALIAGCAYNLKNQIGILNDEKNQMLTDASNGDINWTSIAVMGIDGTGIISGFQGLDPDIEEVKLTGNKIFHQTELKSSSNADTPIEDIVLKYHTFNSSNSVKVDQATKYGSYMSNLILTGQTYNEYNMPQRLKNAFVQMMTRVSFFAENVDTPIYLDISVPFRNFHSWCVSQMTYLNFAENIFDSTDFNFLKDLLLNNVDKCVMKACGVSFNSENDSYELVEKDSKHLLYNYWIDRAVELYLKNSADEMRTKIKESFTELKNILQLAIDDLQEPLSKESSKMTYNDFVKYYSYALSCEEFNKRNLIDDFFFTYVNILYYYRLYFIGKRFNKEDGTMWMMRALESVIDLTAPNNPEIPPKSPKEFMRVSSYPVAFYEKQNTLDMKREVIITPDSPPLTTDKVNRIYVKVQWTTKDNWEKYKKYVEDPITNPKVQKVDRFIVNGLEKFALVPEDGLYLFRAKEYDDNIKADIWNENHQDKVQKTVIPYKECPLNIQWENAKGKTPIRWNVFGTINVDNLLEYSKDSITGRDLVCLIEEGADFWTIDIPEQYWPECQLYKTGLYIVQAEEAESDITKDAYTTVIGPFANSLSPVVREKFDPTPGLMTEIQQAIGKL